MISFQKQLLGVASAVLLVLGAAEAHAGKLGVFTSDAHGFDTHTFYYDDGQEVTLIDTQFVPALTQAMVEQVKRETRSPITRVIVTHPNPDKFNGLAYLHTLGVESISSQAAAEAMPAVHAYKKYFFVNMAKMFTDETYPKFENVKTTFSGQMQIRLKSGETLSLIELKNPGVTSTQVVVRIDKTGDLIVGDLVHHKAHLWLEGAIVNGKPHADLVKWAAAVGELPALAKNKPDAKVYGGRGEFVGVTQAVMAQRAYLRKADALLDDYIAQLGERKAELSDPALSGSHHAELAKRFAQAFPDYALPYMVKYSVYGLIVSKLRTDADLADYFVPAPSRSGKLIGYRLSPNNRQPKLEQMGLLPNDIVTAVHALPLILPGNRMIARERLASGEFESVTFVRDGNRLITITLLPDAAFNDPE